MMPLVAVDVTAVIVALIGAGLLDWARNLVKARLQARREGIAALSPEGRAADHLAFADASILVVAKARDELAEDNTRLRSELAETRATAAEERLNHATEREAWRVERAEMRREIDLLETRLRGVRERLDKHYPDES